MQNNQNNNSPTFLVSPRIRLLMEKKQIALPELAKRLKMPVKQLERILGKDDWNYTVRLLSKILWELGYKIEGLRLSESNKIFSEKSENIP